MNAVVKTLVIGGVVVGAFATVISHNSAEEQKLDLAAKLAQLKEDYVERAAYTYSLGDADRWRDELATQTKWYEAQLDDIRNHHPGAAPQDVLAQMTAAEKAGHMSAAQFQTRKDFYDLTKAFYDQLESGKYNFIQSSTMFGVRFDLLGIHRATNDGKSRLRVDVAVWGAPRHRIDTTNHGQVTSEKVSLDLSFDKLSAEFVDDHHKLVGGGDTGGPAYFVDYPERWIPDFPPQAALAVWYIDPMPANAKTVTLSIDGELRSQADQPLPVSIKADLDVQDDWRVKAGETFKGETRVMDAKDMERK